MSDNGFTIPDPASFDEVIRASPLRYTCPGCGSRNVEIDDEGVELICLSCELSGGEELFATGGDDDLAD